MSQNKHNFNYIKDNSKSRSEIIIKIRLRNGDCFGMKNGVIAIMIDKGLNFHLSQINQF